MEFISFADQKQPAALNGRPPGADNSAARRSPILRGVATVDGAFRGPAPAASGARIEAARRVPIETVARQAGIERTLHRAGAEFVGPCPKCGGYDRFSINLAKQVWNCRKCDEGGDAIKLLMHCQGITFVDAVARLTPDFKEPVRRTEFVYRGIPRRAPSATERSASTARAEAKPLSSSLKAAAGARRCSMAASGWPI
jgi:CHC2 zinc finger